MIQGAAAASASARVRVIVGGEAQPPEGALWVSPTGSGTQYTQANPGTLSGANAAVTAGGTVVLKGGNYSTAVAPAASGTASNNMITYQKAPNEQPVIIGGSNAVILTNRSWIKVDGINAHGGAMNPNATWDSIVVFDNTHNCTLQNGIFEYGNINGLLLRNGSTFNKILNNKVDFVGQLGTVNDVGEGIQMRDCNFCLIEGNVLRHGGHNLLRCKPVLLDGSENTDFNVIRNNDMMNMWDDVAGYSPGDGNRCAEVLFCVGCVIEGNLMRNVGLPPDVANPNGMKIEGERHIVRRNYLFNTIAVGFSQTIRAPETPWSKNSRIYHNSMWGIGYGSLGGAAFDLDHGTEDTTDLTVSENNIWKNNAVFDSDTPQIELRFRGQSINNGSQVVNNGFGPTAFDIVIGGASRANGAFSNAVRGNFTASSFSWVGGTNPLTPAGFTPQSGSPLINAGEHLTTTTSASSGTSVPVADAKYFYNGHGITTGDQIQIGSELATVTAVNYSTNTLTVTPSITWANGAGVSQPYNGAAPDVGAVEAS